MILTDARAGLARSGATRSGYPVLEGFKVPLYAISNIARSAATRSNYTGLTAFIDIGGVPLGHKVLRAGASLTDTLDETPTTGNLSTFNFHPVEGQDVAIRLGTRNNRKALFAGTILAITRRYEGKPANGFDDCRLIDYTWGLGRRQVRARYVSVTVAEIVADLLATYTSGYAIGVAADIGAEVVDEITFTETSVPAALTDLTRRVGGSWICDYDKTVRVFFKNTVATAPRPLNAVHPTLLNFAATRDLSQIVTRAAVEGGGVSAFANCPPGETILPLDGDPGWYASSGGVVVCGPQRLTYTGVSASTGGGMVGPGAAPSGAPVAALTPGTGIETGEHKYAVTFTTAAGESIAGPAATITVGPVAAPVAAPVPETPQGGDGPEVGAHGYAVTFGTATGETLPSPMAVVSSGLSELPQTAPSMVNAPAPAAPGVDPGLHEYAVTFVNPAGETPIGPISPPMPATAIIAGPPAAATAQLGEGTALGLGSYAYGYTFVSGGGETTVGPLVSIVTGGIAVPPQSGVGTDGAMIAASAWVAGDSLAFATAYTNSALGLLSAASPVSPTYIATALSGGLGSPAHYALVTVTRCTDARCDAIRIFVRRNGTWIGWSSVANTTMTIAVGTAPNAGSPPSALRGVYVNDVAPGPAGTIRRNIYRTTVNGPGSSLGMVASINNNTGTSVLDNMPDAGRAGPPPATGTATATAAAMPLVNIARGPAGTTGRNLYRRSGGAGLKFVALIAGNSASTYTDVTPNASLGVAPPTTNTAITRVIPLSEIPLGAAPLVTLRKIYRTVANGSQLKLLTTLFDNSTTEYLDTIHDGSLGANAPTVTTAQANRVQLTAIPLGAAAVTSRKLYRTIANGSQLKLLTALADNTTTTYLDSASLSTLGANVPIADTSGLTQPSGSVNPGATAIQIANIGPFPPAGWAVIGNGQQVIRYTGVSGNTLTGIPSSGPGAIVAAISYNSTVTAAPVLTGIPAAGAGAIVYQILKGDAVNILITVDDVPAQLALAAMIGGDGVQEHYLQDRRLSMREATSRAAAQLELRRDVHVEIRFQTHDINTRAGAMIEVNLGAPFHIIGAFLIQQVGIEFLPTPIATPVFTASASSYRLSFEDLVRAIKAKD